jgi:hypothetical protein
MKKNIALDPGLVHRFAKPRRIKNTRRQPKWMKSVKIGDILEDAHGSRRVVRSVTFYSCGALHSVSFTIKHCSWTHRCDTLYVDRNTLRETIESAGRLIGLGDFRPTFGRFGIVKFE